MVSTAQNYLMMILYLYLLSRDIEVFDSDRVEGIVGANSYIVSRLLVYFPFLTIAPIIFMVIIYYMAGLREGAFGWFIVAGIFSNIGYFAQAFACVAIARQFDAATVISNSLSIIPSFATGFNQAIATIPVWVSRQSEREKMF